MTKFRLLKDVLKEEDRLHCQNMWYSHHIILSDVMEITYTDMGIEKEERVMIVKMKPGYKGWTPSGCIRDCGKYYIKANYSSYTKIDKKTLQVIEDDCEDR